MIDTNVTQSGGLSSSQGSRTRVLLIGPLPPAKITPSNPVGGASVNFAEMVRQLDLRNLQLSLVDTTRHRVNLGRWRLLYNNVTAGFRIVCGVLQDIKKVQVVVLNISAGSACSLGALIWLLCALFGRPMMLRLFGGDFAVLYDRYHTLKRWWANITYMQASLIFVQTKGLMSRFSAYGNFRWFPNARDVRPRTTEYRSTIRRFLFISQLRLEKGLREVLRACRDLPAHCELSIYGPPMPNIDMGLIERHPIARYHGVLQPNEVPEVMIQHDVLLFPTYWESEGYPGILLEALQCGRPAITTRWKSIPEVVQDGRSGILVEPQSWIAVKDAIQLLMRDTQLYYRLCRGAVARGECFRSSIWYDRMVDEISRVAAT